MQSNQCRLFVNLRIDPCREKALESFLGFLAGFFTCFNIMIHRFFEVGFQFLDRFPLKQNSVIYKGDLAKE